MGTRKWRSETDTSRTAEIVCLTRAVSQLDERPAYRCGDYVAPLVMPARIRPFLRLGAARRFFAGRISPFGMYEYVIARTRYIDETFARCVGEGAEQALVLGAGFDSRSIRFASAGARIFEVDAAATQAAKLRQYARRGIGVPSCAVFVPMDFERQSLREELERAGFASGRRSLFVLEGLTMYLDGAAIDATLRELAALAGPGSELVLDFVRASVIGGEGLYRGEGEIRGRVAKYGEAWAFGLEAEDARAFLAARGFELAELLGAEELEERYFRGQGGAGEVSGTHFIARAVASGEARG